MSVDVTTSPESVYDRLEPLLPRVRKPVQYVGGERNATVTPWEDAEVHWALCYPDAYEVGLPNQGLMILYEVLNERPDALAERDRKSTRLNSSHSGESRMPSSA